jgi:hypothetical protein
MLDRFDADITITPRTALMQYCQMENVLPLAQVRASRPVSPMKLRLKATAYHLLQHLAKSLNVLISRLAPEMERKIMVQGRLS